MIKYKMSSRSKFPLEGVRGFKPVRMALQNSLVFEYPQGLL